MYRKVSLSRVPWLVKLLPLLLILGACATGAIREKRLTLPVVEGATSVGSEACLECHEGMSAGIHSRLAGFEYMGGTEGCEACHGGGSLHVKAADNGQILKFGDLLPEESAAICAKCHTDGKLVDWTHGEHALSDVSCNDCHSVHGGGKTALKQQDPELCYSCHQEQQAKASFPSHHPIKEGKMTCGDCHNPHGELQTDEQVRDLCLNCHTRYQGPFVFEHAPVEEDCNICHDPHGTVANNLLQQNEPFLCLQCHESHFHTTRIGGSVPANNVAFNAYNPDGTVATPPNVGDLAGAPTSNTVQITNTLGEHSWQMAFGTKCTVCHSTVHGSDLPSQSSPSVNTNPNVPGGIADPGSGHGQGFPSGGAGLTR
jgi:DmsE family decaheme c-type cytochrome